MREMKDSGIEWIGKIPQNWGVDKIKYRLLRDEPRNPGKTIVLSVYRDYGVIPKNSRSDNHNVTSEDTSKYKYVKKGQLVINKMKAWQGSLAISNYNGIVSPAYFVYSFRDKTYQKKYFHYLIRNCYKGEFRRISGGLREGQWDLSPEAFGNTLVLVPPIDEQQQIADFLDSKCSEIDAITADIQKEITVLENYKKSVITEAVTKGLNPNVEMKDSGIEWIGEIAKKHPLKRLKYLVEILDAFRKPITAQYRNQNASVLYNYYGASGIIDKIDGYTINDHVMLIGEDGANLRLRNLPLLYEVNGKAWINNHAHILKPKKGNSFYYLFYALESLDINCYVTGSAQPKLNQENLKNILVPVPSYKEQLEIATFLKSKCSEIDATIADKQKQLETLSDYKKSLIYEYVTGKKEVPCHE